MSTNAWQRSTSLRPPDVPCPHCGEESRPPVLASGGGHWNDRGVWRCAGCAKPLAVLSFKPTQVPDGREQIEAAVRLIGVRVPALTRCDQGSVYEILRPYFVAGWCVRDVIRALDYLPDGQPHPGQGVAWSIRESPDKTMWAMLQRLRAWRWRDRPDRENIMRGWWTEMSNAMTVAKEEQDHRAAVREEDWAQQRASARASDGTGRALARRQAEIAAGIANRHGVKRTTGRARG